MADLQVFYIYSIDNDNNFKTLRTHPLIGSPVSPINVIKTINVIKICHKCNTNHKCYNF